MRCAVWVARCGAVAVLVWGGVSFGQGVASPPTTAAEVTAEKAETMARVTALRDQFVAKVHAAGKSCAFAPPTISLEDVPSFGHYDEKANTLRTSDWTMLRPEERAFFFQLAGPQADEGAAHQNFEQGVHRWVFVHELGHWWQACTQKMDGPPPYSVESGADRIALAFWREEDAGFAEGMLAVFGGIVGRGPNPVPAGQRPEAYFNANYEQLAPTPAYIWFQSRMVVEDGMVQPEMTFAQTLAKPSL